MQTHTLMPFLVAMFVAVAAMPTSVFQVCAWGHGTLKIDAWRIKTAAAFRAAAQTIRSWFSSLWSPQLALASLAVLLAIVWLHGGVHQDGLLLAIPIPAAIAAMPATELTARRATLLREADALRAADGSFATDQARTDFDTRMTEVDAIDAQLRALAANPQPPQPAGADVAAARTVAIAEERTRVVGIQTTVRAAKLAASVADDMIGRGISLETARAEVLATLSAAQGDTPTRQHVVVVPAGDATDKFMRGAANWLLIKSGHAELVARRENPAAPNLAAIDPGEFRGLTLVELARETLERAGRHVRGLDKMRMVSEAFTVRGTVTQTTSDFAVLLENVMHKVLLAAYAVQPDTWRRFCAQGTVSDFRAHNRYRMGTFGTLDAINEAGEFKSKGITDAEKATITASTKGNIINISRQAIVNDDMNAFARLLAMLGRAAGLSVEVDVYALLAQNAGLGPTMDDNVVLFDAAHSNVGAGAAISAASLDADAAVMAAQTDKDGNEILNIEPAVLLVPRGLKGQAIVINESQFDPDTVANKAQNKPNVVRGFVRDIIGTARLAAGTTRRYLFADPSVYPVLEVAFLEGATEPVLETRDGWNTDGAEMKVRFDYGVAAVDYRGAVTNAGV